MRVIYADSGLVSEVGHHANSCRMIAGELRRRGHAVTVAAFQGVEQALAAELGATPHFRLNTYWANDGDPVCGWLNAFFTGGNVFAEDLATLGPFDASDLIYVNSILPAQLMGLRSFLLALPDGSLPHVIAELGTGPGLDFERTAEGPRFIARDPRIDSRATLYRFAGSQIRASRLPELHVCSFDPASSEIYSLLLGIDVGTLPVPRFTDAAPRRRGAQRPIVIGVLGHQRGEKGYHLVPEIAGLLLRDRSDIRFLVHNAQPDFMSDTQAAMRRLAAQDARVTLDETPAGPERWRDLLDRSDLILCPYMPDQFRAAYSAVASEAIAHAIPLVVPAETTLARVLGDFGNPGTTFAAFSPDAIARAVVQALDGFDELASRAMSASSRWRSTMGAANMVDAMLALTAGADMLARLDRRGDPKPKESRRAAIHHIPAEKVA